MSGKSVSISVQSYQSSVQTSFNTIEQRNDIKRQNINNADLSVAELENNLINLHNQILFDKDSVNEAGAVQLATKILQNYIYIQEYNLINLSLQILNDYEYFSGEKSIMFVIVPIQHRLLKIYDQSLFEHLIKIVKCQNQNQIIQNLGDMTDFVSKQFNLAVSSQNFHHIINTLELLKLMLKNYAIFNEIDKQQIITSQEDFQFTNQKDFVQQTPSQLALNTYNNYIAQRANVTKNERICNVVATVLCMDYSSSQQAEQINQFLQAIILKILNQNSDFVQIYFKIKFIHKIQNHTFKLVELQKLEEMFPYLFEAEVQLQYEQQQQQQTLNTERAPKLELYNQNKPKQPPRSDTPIICDYEEKHAKDCLVTTDTRFQNKNNIIYNNRTHNTVVRKYGIRLDASIQQKKKYQNFDASDSFKEQNKTKENSECDTISNTTPKAFTVYANVHTDPRFNKMHRKMRVVQQVEEMNHDKKLGYMHIRRQQQTSILYNSKLTPEESKFLREIKVRRMSEDELFEVYKRMCDGVSTLDDDQIVQTIKSELIKKFISRYNLLKNPKQIKKNQRKTQVFIQSVLKLFSGKYSYQQLETAIKQTQQSQTLTDTKFNRTRVKSDLTEIDIKNVLSTQLNGKQLEMFAQLIKNVTDSVLDQLDGQLKQAVFHNLILLLREDQYIDIIIPWLHQAQAQQLPITKDEFQILVDARDRAKLLKNTSMVDINLVLQFYKQYITDYGVIQ